MSVERLPEGALAQMLDAAPDGIVMAGADGRIRYVNTAAEDLFGYARGELIGSAVEQLIPARLRGSHVADRTAYAQHPQPRPMGLGLHLQGLRHDGSEVPVEISLAPMSFDGEQSIVAVVREATERRRIEEERMRYAQAHAVEEIVAALDAIVWESTTPDRESLTYLGGREEMLLGYPREQWMQPGFWMSLVHPEDRLAALTFVEAAQQSENFELLYRMISADGEVRQVRDIVTVTRDGNGGGIQRLRGVITDITERQEITARLTQAQKMEAVGQLAGGIAHDFNNLLTIVSGYARRLSARADLASARPDLEQILLASDRAADLTRQLLAFARRGHTEATLIDVSALARELEPMLRRLLAADIVFEFQLAPGLPQVMMDRTGLEQIMMNLMINASDAMPAGGTLRVTTRGRSVPGEEAAVHGLDAGAFVELAISDSGTGMSPETVERIFEPFFSTKGERGTGMGLATVYGTVDQADGWIDVTSTVGEGTTFTVMLPAAGEPETTPAPDPQMPTLLLVEDEPALRLLVVTMLEEQGYAVLQAGNGLDAIALAERHRGDIDLLLTDVVMPRLSGPELAQQLRALRPGLEVLFMSGYNDSRLVHRGVEEAKVNLLVKPFSPDELVERVGQLTGAS